MYFRKHKYVSPEAKLQRTGSPQCCFSSVCTTFTDYVKRYATEEALKEQEAAQAESSDSESSMSDFSEDEAQGMEL